MKQTIRILAAILALAAPSQASVKFVYTSCIFGTIQVGSFVNPPGVRGDTVHYYSSFIAANRAVASYAYTTSIAPVWSATNRLR